MKFVYLLPALSLTTVDLLQALPQEASTVHLIKRNAAIAMMAAQEGEREVGSFTRLISGTAAKQARLDIERSKTDLNNFASDTDKYQEDTDFQLTDSNRNTGLAYDQYRYQVDQDALDASRNSDFSLYRDFLMAKQRNQQIEMQMRRPLVEYEPETVEEQPRPRKIKYHSSKGKQATLAKHHSRKYMKPMKHYIDQE